MKRSVKRVRKGFRLTQEADNMLEMLAKHLGISQTDVVEQALRTLARQQGILPM